MNLHAEVLPPQQAMLLRSLGPAADSLGFVLGGGTAVALHLGHRRSLDFDWFTQDRIDDPVVLAARIVGNDLPFEPSSVDRGTLHGRIDAVRVSFLEYPYAPLQPATEWPEFGCRLASLEDLACMKLSAVAGRGARKDFVDIHALGSRCFELSRMLTLYQRRYGIRDVGHVLFALVFFDDAEREPMPEMLWDTRWNEIRESITNWVRQLDRASMRAW
jgi:hypothetical protein